MKCMTCTGKQTSNEASDYDLVKNIWICKLKTTASGKARCLAKSALFVATLNHYFVKESSTPNQFFTTNGVVLQ